MGETLGPKTLRSNHFASRSWSSGAAASSSTPFHPPPDDGQGTHTGTTDDVAPRALVHQMVSPQLVDVALGVSENTLQLDGECKRRRLRGKSSAVQSDFPDPLEDGNTDMTDDSSTKPRILQVIELRRRCDAS